MRTSSVLRIQNWAVSLGAENPHSALWATWPQINYWIFSEPFFSVKKWLWWIDGQKMALIPLALFYLYAFCCTFFGLPIVRIQFPMPQLGCLWTCLSTRPRAGQGAAWRLVRCPGSCPFAFAWEQPWAGFLGGKTVSWEPKCPHELRIRWTKLTAPWTPWAPPMPRDPRFSREWPEEAWPKCHNSLAVPAFAADWVMS